MCIRDSTKWAGRATAQTYTWLQDSTGVRRRLTEEEIGRVDTIAGQVFSTSSLDSQTNSIRSVYDVEFHGKTYRNGKRHWATPPEGMARLIRGNRVVVSGDSIRYVRFM